ncbi:hypothetical protein GO013_00010 [Pseudodesulfovibrio sp. JC047]|uniref:DUF6088 family protein n=1 Tax=Pseudodesulfovibrio sp. JC047 TaxID=2683199 RepID=UPI0013D795BC|nr:DUF6088 family protein [Pseudodesulfovibrio sp. JC047]NDV17801.1 hypothetical protein [Pseudodesulfovibrio sp. JC047]
MQIYEQVKRKVARLKAGRLITYNDFKELNKESPQALAKTLQRLVENGTLVRQKKGVFYKAKKTRFGELKPTDNEILKSMLLKNGKYTGYLSGLAVYLLFKISTQVPNETTIATPDPSKKKSSNRLAAKYVKSYVKKINKENIYYLQVLDALRFIKKAQDTSPTNVISAMTKIIDSFESAEIKKLTTYALQYPPSTKAMYGAIIDSLGYKTYASIIKESLNPNSKYSIGISSDQLPNKEEWRIQ